MAESCVDCESGNAYGIRLTMLAPRGKGRTLDRIVSSLTDWVDPSKQIVDVDEMLPEEEQARAGKKPDDVSGSLVTPALSIMLFVRETGEMCIDDVEKVLKKPPWEFHHKVELHNKRTPKTALAKQEFFKLANDLPLFAACPVLTENEHLRINMYVHNYPAMVEFYRIITDTEIETNKPEFCIFELYRQPGLDIQLSLKRCQYIYPVPVESAYISFNIRNIEVVKQGTSSEVEHVGSNVYTTRDPDGNLVVLYEIDLNTSSDCYNLAGSCCVNQTCLDCKLSRASGSFDDVKSLKSTSESHDSGRYSDLEGTNGDSVFVAEGYEQSGTIPKHKDKKEREKSEGYQSSSSSNLTIKNEPNASEVKPKQNSKTGRKSETKSSKQNSKPLTKSNAKGTKSNSNTSKGGNFTPVYI